MRPCAAVVFAAAVLAEAASRVRFFAVVRARRPVDFDGDFAPVAALLRVVVDRLAAGLRAVVERFAGVVVALLGAEDVVVASVVVEVVVLSVAIW